MSSRALLVTACVILALIFASTVCAQETVLYQFGAAGSNDGNYPSGGLIFDGAGNMYGTTSHGGAGGGTVFELSPVQGGSYQETILYNFCPGGIEGGCPDGYFPNGSLIMDADGDLYGTTSDGGICLCGTVFEMSPPSLPGGSWTEQVLWSFAGYTYGDGQTPYSGLVTDSAGNLYGTTSAGGAVNAGTVFELSLGKNGWSETILYSFCPNYPDCSDGVAPTAGVTFDKVGNLYGTTRLGGRPGAGWGVAYELSPTKSGWTETVLKTFSSGTGSQTTVGITIDPQGNLYGGLTLRGPDQCGGYFHLLPFEGFVLQGGNGCLPASDLVYSSGAMFATTLEGGRNSKGVVFKLTEKGSKVSQTILYDFCQQENCIDGSIPSGSPTLRNGQLYGATEQGGLYNFGVIYQVAE